MRSSIVNGSHQAFCCCVMSAELSEQDRLDWGQKLNREELQHNLIYFLAK